MKTTTKLIYAFLKSENFTDLNALKEAVEANNFSEEIYQDTNFEEAYEDLNHIVDTIVALINKNNLFDKITSYSIRNITNNTLSDINTYITNIKNGTNHVTQLIQSIETLKEKINLYSIELFLTGSPLYYEKLRQVNYLKSKYANLISVLKKAERIKKDTDDIFNDVAEKYEGITESADGIEETQNTIDSIKEDIDKRYEQIKIHDTNIADYEIQSKNNKDEITNFFNKIDENDEKMDSAIKKIEGFITVAQIGINKNIEENTFKTEQIINVNESIQQNIFDLLGKAVGTNLYKSFKEKVKWMRWQSLGWLLLLICSIVFISITGKDVIKILSELIKNGQNNNIGLSFYLKTTLIFPAIYAIYFSASQFKNTNKLLEEYEFKSAVSIVLHYFKDQVEKAKENDNTQDFLIRSIEKIFESPTDKVFGRKLSTKKKESILNEILDFTKDNAKNM